VAPPPETTSISTTIPTTTTTTTTSNDGTDPPYLQINTDNTNVHILHRHSGSSTTIQQRYYTFHRSKTRDKNT
jgi:hypothetical protein